ncbi:MAG: glutamate 5-kinase [Deltaproteobacteria bacterium]|nr:MAG: glutamate 5-kinase [Deltaproteobacteria bacterium]
MRNEIMQGVRRAVIKVGSSLLVSLGTGLNKDFISRLTKELAWLNKKGGHIVMVSSGAIAAGMERLNLTKRPKTISELQAAAAIGQSTLMHVYEEAFAPWGLKVAQVLLTHEDMKERKRYINARNTLLTLLDMGVIPIINENDSVVVEEIKFGDNDLLAALVTSLVDADLLLILTDIDGLYDGEPHRGGRFITLVERVNKEVEEMAWGSQREIGTGGMVSKVGAAKLAAQFGVPTVVTSGRAKRVLKRVFAGERMGTLFLARSEELKRRKQWIGFTLRPKGELKLDKGAQEAIVRGGKSLLPSGIIAVEGDFGRGDPVSCLDPQGKEFARGLVQYDSRELREIMGRQSSQIEEMLGYKYTDEVIHRDNLVVL